MLNLAQTFTNKVIAAASNTITGLVDANIDAHTSTKITITDKTHLHSAIAYTDPAVTMGDFNLTLKDNRLVINNPADTFTYTFITAAIAANRTITLPLLTGNDIMAVLDFAQTFTNKTYNTTNNTLTATSAVAGALLLHNGTKYDKLDKGANGTFLGVSGGSSRLFHTTTG